jgi:hypothetical protein
MPTRLLDWTTNPLAALFFAVEEQTATPTDGEFFMMEAKQILPEDAGNKFKLWDAVGVRNPYTIDAIRQSFWNEHKRQPLIIPILPDNTPGRVGQQNSRFTLTCTTLRPQKTSP